MYGAVLDVGGPVTGLEGLVEDQTVRAGKVPIVGPKDATNKSGATAVGRHQPGDPIPATGAVTTTAGGGCQDGTLDGGGPDGGGLDGCLDWGLDGCLDWGLDRRLDWGLDWGLNRAGSISTKGGRFAPCITDHTLDPAISTLCWDTRVHSRNI